MSSTMSSTMVVFAAISGDSDMSALVLPWWSRG